MYRFLKMLKDEFRVWYGTVSIEEIMTNADLISGIEQTEKVISSIEQQLEDSRMRRRV